MLGVVGAPAAAPLTSASEPLRRFLQAARGAGLRFNRSLAAISMPGVHMPHCAAACLWNAVCSESRRPLIARPSTVVTAFPAACPSGVRQAQTWQSSSSTVQAPQSPALHPILVPVRPSSSRSTSARREAGAAHDQGTMRPEDGTCQGSVTVRAGRTPSSSSAASRGRARALWPCG